MNRHCQPGALRHASLLLLLTCLQSVHSHILVSQYLTFTNALAHTCTHTYTSTKPRFGATVADLLPICAFPHTHTSSLYTNIPAAGRWARKHTAHTWRLRKQTPAPWPCSCSLPSRSRPGQKRESARARKRERREREWARSG